MRDESREIGKALKVAVTAMCVGGRCGLGAMLEDVQTENWEKRGKIYISACMSKNFPAYAHDIAELCSK